MSSSEKLWSEQSKPLQKNISDVVKLRSNRADADTLKYLVLYYYLGDKSNGFILDEAYGKHGLDDYKRLTRIAENIAKNVLQKTPKSSSPCAPSEDTTNSFQKSAKPSEPLKGDPKQKLTEQLNILISRKLISEKTTKWYLDNHASIAQRLEELKSGQPKVDNSTQMRYLGVKNLLEENFPENSVSKNSTPIQAPSSSPA